MTDYLITERCGALAGIPPASSHLTERPGVALAQGALRRPGDHVTVTGTNRDYMAVISAAGPEAVDAEVGGPGQGISLAELQP